MDWLKAVLAILRLAAGLYDRYRRSRDAHKNKEFLDALRSGDIDRLNKLLKPGV